MSCTSLPWDTSIPTTSSAACSRPPTAAETWKKVLYISEKVGVVEVAIDPSDNKTLYAVAWERDRKAWNNVIAGPGSGIYKSTDAGETWKLLTKGLPTGEKVGRMGIAVAPSNPNVLYLICDHRGVGGEVYRSDNKGESWRKTHEGNVKTGIGYDFCLIRVMPDNADEIFIVRFQPSLFTRRRQDPDEYLRAHRSHAVVQSPARHSPLRQSRHVHRSRRSRSGHAGYRWRALYIARPGQDVAPRQHAPHRRVLRHLGRRDVSRTRSGAAPRITACLEARRNRWLPGEEHWEWDHGGDNYVTRIDPNDLDTMYLEGMFGSMARKRPEDR